MKYTPTPKAMQIPSIITIWLKGWVNLKEITRFRFDMVGCFGLLWVFVGFAGDSALAIIAK